MSDPRVVERVDVWRVLVNHFFRRFFDNDTIQVEGDTQTTVVRALSMTAVPGLMVAFWSQSHAPHRPPAELVKQHYFFVLLSFVVMGIVALFELEMLFPDRLDFLVLSPLSLKPRQVLSAKGAALLIFVGMFLGATNLFGELILPAVSGGAVWHQVLAHGVATLMAGTFASLFFLALGSVLLSVFGAAQLRWISPLIRMLAICGLVLLVLHYVLLGDFLLAMLQESHAWMRWLPPVWFLGLYEQLLQGSAAPAFAAPMARVALWATVASVAVAVLSYPLAWVRARRAAIEGVTARRLGAWPWTERLVHLVIRQPGERAVFAFIRQTLARSNRYQVYLAMYCGTGLAFAMACGVSVHLQSKHVYLGLSPYGLYAIVPLMIFWIIAGLRAAFGLPVNLQAGWIFRVTGVMLRECAAAARSWAMMSSLAMLACILVILHGLGWDARRLFVQAGTGFCLTLLLSNAFFFAPDHVPFNKPRMPGKSSFVLLLTLYFGALPPFIFIMIDIEKEVEQKLTRAIGWSIFTAVVWGLMEWRRRRSPVLEEDTAEYSGEYLLLGLSQQ